MSLSLKNAIDFFVAGTLVILAVAVLSGQRHRRSSTFILSLFLVLIAANFFFNGLAEYLWNNSTSQEPEVRRQINSLRVIGYVALALDPLFLALFTTGFPYRRRPAPIAAVLVCIGGLSAASLVGYLLSLPELAATSFIPPKFTTTANLFVANLIVGYLAAWIAAILALVHAPTQQLRRQAGWMVIAVGAATLPRIGFAWQDFRYMDWISESIAGLWEQSPMVRWWFLLALAGVNLALILIAWGAGRLVVWRRSAGDTAVVRSVRIALVLAFLLWALGTAVQFFQLVEMIPNGGFLDRLMWMPYSFRWLVFAALLTYGLLAHELMSFRRAADRIVRGVGAATGALAFGLGMAVFLVLREAASGMILPMSVMASVAAAAPAGQLSVRGLRPLLDAEAERGGDAHRLELYRAALEKAWAHGEPSKADRGLLERERRRLGVSFEEGRALGHVVATGSISAPRAALGDEVDAGLVLEATLGVGAQGRVYLARRHIDDRQVVVKELRVGRSGRAGARRDLMVELQALERLDHANLVKLLEVHVDRDRYLLVLEYVAGGTLADRLADGPLGDDEVRQVAEGLLAGLAAAHAAGVVHRDIKPANILMGPGGKVKLTDFGVAETSEADPTMLQATTPQSSGRVSGTLAYMAPEQALGDPATPATDLYSLGLVIYEMVTGRRAREASGITPQAFLLQIARSAPNLSAVPERWRPLVGGLLAQDARSRMDGVDAREALAALHAS